jgi:VCBS repeat-containing protein
LTLGSPVSVTMSEDGKPVSWVAPELSAVDLENDALSWSASIQPTHGIVSVSGTGSSPETFTYKPTPDYAGSDSFTVQVSDGNLTAKTIVNITIQGINDAPVFAQGSSVSVVISEDGAPISWSAPQLSAYDQDGDRLTWSLSRSPLQGVATVSGQGSSPSVFTYDPIADFSGVDGFEVQVSDGNSSSRITVNVTVTEVSDLPSSFQFEESGSFFENDSVGTIVGRFYPTEVKDDSNTSFSFTPEGNVSASSNAMFSLEINGTLKTNHSFNYEDNSSYLISVRLGNSVGESIDDTFSIRLMDVFLPIVNTMSPTLVGTNFATLHGDVDDSGDDPGGVSNRGFVIGRKPDPFVGGDAMFHLDSGSGMGSFSASVDGLLIGTNYYYRSYAENSEGRRYGAQKRFTTTEQSSLGPVVGAVDRKAGWWISSWFGDFYVTGSDWVYHPDFGWLFVYSENPAGLWLWQKKLGWIWTSDAAFPYFYSSQLSNWLLWKQTTGNVAVFFDYSQSNWISHSLVTSP